MVVGIFLFKTMKTFKGNKEDEKQENGSSMTIMMKNRKKVNDKHKEDDKQNEKCQWQAKGQ